MATNHGNEQYFTHYMFQRHFKGALPQTFENDCSNVDNNEWKEPSLTVVLLAENVPSSSEI